MPSPDSDKEMAPPFPAHSISAIVPCYNEEQCVGEAYKEISLALRCFGEFEILFIDDGSTDRTAAMIKEIAQSDPRVRYMSFARNFGLEAAFSAGFRYARYPWLVQFDADLQSPPGEVTKLFAKALEGYDAVFSTRVGRRDPLHRRWGSTLHDAIARMLGIEVPRRSSIFRVLRTSVARKIVEVDLGMPYFLATVPLVGATFTSVPTSHRARLAGRSKWRLSKLVAHTTELYVGFSTRPLTVMVTLALAVLVTGLGLALSGVVSDATRLARLMMISQLALGFAVAIIAPYLVRIIRGQNRSVSMFLVRDANFPIRPSDSIYEYELRSPVDRPEQPTGSHP